MADPDWLTDFLRAEALPSAYAQAVATVIAPLAERIAEAARAHGPGFVLGLCGAQGSGKSTASAVVAHLLDADGLRVATLSLDDLYLPLEAREQLARDVHPLFRTRGPPGTHDVALGLSVLAGLATSAPTLIPRFDKATDTRAGRSRWTRFDGPADVILFEGWCVGAAPQDQAALVQPVNDLERTRDPDGAWRGAVNAALAGPYQALFAKLDRLVLMRAPSFEVVAGWRREQEQKLRARLAAAGQGTQRTLTDHEIATFVAHYERLTRHILAEMPARADAVIPLAADRTPGPVVWSDRFPQR
ncbi:MAG: kinase [Caulobacterales bacterium]